MEVEKLLEVAQSSQANVSRHLTKSAMTPIILLNMLSVPACFTSAYLFSDDPFLKYPLAGMGILSMLVGCGMYVYLGIFKTERLQTEDYQIRQEFLQMIQKKGGRISIEPISLGSPIPPLQLEQKNEPSA